MGDVAVAVMLAGSNNKPAWFYHRNGIVDVLRIDGKKVTKINEIEVGGLPEAAVFTPKVPISPTPANASRFRPSNIRAHEPELKHWSHAVDPRQAANCFALV
jgi:hypothetical protein